MPGSRPKKHHYIPQVLLAGFTDDGTSAGTLFIADLVRLKTYASTPEGTGAETNYNLLEGDGLDPFGIESDLLATHIEGPVGSVFQKLRSGTALTTDEEKMALLNFMAMQAIRSPNRRDAHNRFTTDVMRQIIAVVTESDETFVAYKRAHPELAELTREDLIEWAANTTMKWGPTGHLRAYLPSFGPIYDLLTMRSWSLLVAPSNVDFVCTDDPVAFVPVGAKSPYAPRGFIDPDPVVMPVGKRHAMLGVFPPPDAEPSWTSMSINARKVAALNTALLAVASRFVASPQDDFTWLRPTTGDIVDRAAFLAFLTGQRATTEESDA